MAGLRLFGTDIDPSNDEADVEEVVGGISVPSKKWSIAEDEILISGWIIVAQTQLSAQIKRRLAFGGR